MKLDWTALDVLIKTLQFLGAIGIFFIGLDQYREGQLWKRQQYIAEQISQFTADPYVRLTMAMLDFSARPIKLPSGTDFDYKEEYLPKIFAGREQAKRILYKGSFAELRDAASAFCDWLAKFEQDISAELVSYEEYAPYLGYWLDLINEAIAQKSAKGKALKNFMDSYGYEAAKALLERRQGQNLEQTNKRVIVETAQNCPPHAGNVNDNADSN